MRSKRGSPFPRAVWALQVLFRRQPSKAADLGNKHPCPFREIMCLCCERDPTNFAKMAQKFDVGDAGRALVGAECAGKFECRIFQLCPVGVAPLILFFKNVCTLHVNNPTVVVAVV